MSVIPVKKCNCAVGDHRAAAVVSRVDATACLRYAKDTTGGDGDGSLFRFCTA